MFGEITNTVQAFEVWWDIIIHFIAVFLLSASERILNKKYFRL